MSFDEDTGLLAAETKLAQNAKKIALMVLGTAAQKYMMGLADQQEVLLNCADIIMDAYQMETAILRAKKIADSEWRRSRGTLHRYGVGLLQRRDPASRDEGEKHASPRSPKATKAARCLSR